MTTIKVLSCIHISESKFHRQEVQIHHESHNFTVLQALPNLPSYNAILYGLSLLYVPR